MPSLGVIGIVSGSGEASVTLDLSGLLASGANGFLIGWNARGGYSDPPTGFADYAQFADGFYFAGLYAGTGVMVWFGGTDSFPTPTVFPSSTTIVGANDDFGNPTHVTAFVIGLRDATLWSDHNTGSVYGWTAYDNFSTWHSDPLFTDETLATPVRPHVIIEAAFFSDFYGDWSGYGGYDHFTGMTITPDSPLTSLVAIDNHGLTYHGAGFGAPYEYGYATDALAVGYVLNETFGGPVGSPQHTFTATDYDDLNISYNSWGIQTGLFFQVRPPAGHWHVGRIVWGSS